MYTRNDSWATVKGSFTVSGAGVKHNNREKAAIAMPGGSEARMIVVDLQGRKIHAGNYLQHQSACIRLIALQCTGTRAHIIRTVVFNP